MSGRTSRDKGNRIEREIVRLLQEHGFAAEKTSAMYKAGTDISVPLLGIDRQCEVKARGHGFGQLYGWLESGADFLIIRANRRKPLVVMPLELAARIARLAERARRNSAPKAESLLGDPGEQNVASRST